MPLTIDSERAAITPELEDLLARVMRASLAVEGIADAGEFSAYLRITDNEEIHQINLAQRGVDRPTDVLSFPSVTYPKGTARDNLKLLRREFDPDSGGMFLGDIIISLERAREQAAEYGHSEYREIGYLTCHALFHLMGYDHMEEDERAVMRAREEEAMRMVSLTRD